jgi:hypothetical protein
MSIVYFGILKKSTKEKKGDNRDLSPSRSENRSTRTIPVLGNKKNGVSHFRNIGKHVEPSIAHDVTSLTSRCMRNAMLRDTKCIALLHDVTSECHRDDVVCREKTEGNTSSRSLACGLWTIGSRYEQRDPAPGSLETSSRSEKRAHNLMTSHTESAWVSSNGSRNEIAKGISNWEIRRQKITHNNKK